jgi:virginiamycin B lyase
MAGIAAAALGAILVAAYGNPDVSARASVDVVFDEWSVPTAKSRPHDPAFAPDGSAWWTGQIANVLGRLDPATGALKEFPLPTEKSGPHGLVADREGNIWYTGQSGRHIGKLDPKTGKVTEYKMPDPRADPHTPIFDWYSESGIQPNTLIRFDPTTGAFQTWKIPNGGGVVRHMVTAPNGDLWLAYSGIDKIGRVRVKKTT